MIKIIVIKDFLLIDKKKKDFLQVISMVLYKRS